MLEKDVNLTLVQDTVLVLINQGKEETFQEVNNLIIWRDKCTAGYITISDNWLTFTNSSKKAEDKKDNNTCNDIQVEVPFNLAAFVSWSTVIHEGFGVMTWKNNISLQLHYFGSIRAWKNNFEM